jgi:superfamily II DNA or RNA helicase
MVLTEGFDCPDLSACILARPTKNYGLYIQMAGRVLRTARGKGDTLIIDHSGAVYRHGKVNDHYEWTLDESGPKEADTQRAQRLREKTVITCANCSAVYSGQINCPECNHVPERKGRYVLSKTGDLVSVDDARRPPNARDWRRHEKVKWFNQFVAYADEKGYKRGWAHRKYKDKFKEWPGKDFPVLDHIVLEPEFKSYIRHLNMKYAYAKRKEEKERADING